MALPASQQLKYWGVVAALVFLMLWWLSDVILPFVLGAALAYLLDPIADALERLGLSRVLSVTVITLLGIVSFLALSLLAIPLADQAAKLTEQLAGLVARAPEIVAELESYLAANYPGLVARIPILGDLEDTARRGLTGLTDAMRARSGTLIEGVMASVSGLVNVLVLLVIVPVVAFYLLLDWDRMVTRLDVLLPRDHAPAIRRIASEIDDTLAGFLRGQGTVCLILGVYYALALSLVGLQFGVVIGALAGILTIVPYVGALVGGALSIGLALFQFWGDWVWVIAVWAVFQSGQFVEGNILTPKLVGDSVRLHPVWLIFALSAFGALFGFVGLLVAVPVAAVIGVVIRFGVEQYRDSPLYRGLSKQAAIDADIAAAKAEHGEDL